MTTKVILGAALGAMMMLPAAPVFAGGGTAMPVYPYKASANNCPAGLQPVVVGGVICCGSPNQNMSYASMMAHPVAKKKVYRKHVVRRVAKTYCPEGMKGCN